MKLLEYKGDELHFDGIPIRQIEARYGTPTYLYSARVIKGCFREYKESFGTQPNLICYAVKANSNLSILNLLAKMGSGFDIVSGGELKRVLKAGGDPKKIVFSGIGKNVDEIKAALNVGIYCFNVESHSELQRLISICQEIGKKAQVSVRVNPDVDAKTHPYISTGLKENKFGVPWNDVMAIYKEASASRYISVIGIDCHIGSQMIDPLPFIDAAKRITSLSNDLKNIGIQITHLDFGGGLGISYQGETPPSPKNWVESVLSVVDNKEMKILIEPGRSIAGPAGILLTKVEYIKKGDVKNFLIVDAAMNDLARPALYNSYHEIKEVKINIGADLLDYEVVGPICETGDFLAKNRSLATREGEILAIMEAGAYGMSMASNYNSRGRPAEVLIDSGDHHLIRRRENVEDLYSHEPFPCP